MAASSRHLYLGWDVGGWHCDRGKSRDALVLIESDANGLQKIGEWGPKNLATHLLKLRGEKLARQLIELCVPEFSDRATIVVAIDTPLGWPDAFHSLLNLEGITQLSEFGDATNPYTRRRTEIDIIKSAVPRMHRLSEEQRGQVMPLSPVRDLIGSQATKGMHFLQAVGLQALRAGVYKRSFRGLSIEAIEAYPSLARAARNGMFEYEFNRLKIDDWKEDLSDALRCALVAYLYCEHPKEIATPPAKSRYSKIEGRIFYPRVSGR